MSRLSGYEGLQRIWDAIPSARLVGGCVRDLLCGRAVRDVDVASPLHPHDVQERLEKIGARVVPTGLSHGTVTAVINHQPYEITTLRRDVETDGRHAVVVWTNSWEEDAARRDFTINAMSIDHEGVLYDYFGGKTDLEAHKVRFVGNAESRIEEDALRSLRFFRFQARYGDEEVDPCAYAAIAEKRDLITRLSVERVASELLKILSGPHVGRTIRLMLSAGVLPEILPHPHVDLLEDLLKTGHPSEPLPRLYVLSGGDRSVGELLKLSNAERSALQAFARSEPELFLSASDDDLRRIRASQSLPLLVSRSWLQQARSVIGPDPQWDQWRQRLEALPQPVFPLSGRDGLMIGLASGPQLGRWLKKAQQWWMAEGCRPDHGMCLTWLKEQVSREG
ncbi:CCA tRNA nucleotidyltransferase [Saccharibacter sp. 17.LH.SD]|uniref:CCA tRNA nucleotidyltransferase n=1 Tax=Saccharibacter sp. 17.LH.SD TaxID=2689393 RepID=UPI001927A75A|nr:CCA tRNA nucleotidyltransferase [Saccharibacter sp. 17.LH.SD]